MAINFTAPQRDTLLKPRITVFGVGGAGGNAVNNMIDKKLDGVDFVVANTDAQAIAQSNAPRQIQLGASITHGLGAGARPDMGRAAAEEAIEDINENLDGSHMVFIAAGMGGGTGTGAAPVIARLAREQGMLTVGVVTKPFHFEGKHRMRIAESGIEEMQQFVDTLIIIPNQNLFRIANEKTTFADAFSLADDVLHSGVRGVTDLMVVPGLINLDFADIRSVMSEMGKAMMGTGEADGEDRARLAAEAAISNPLLDDVSMRGARGVLINITGGPDMTLFEVDEAANRIGDEVDQDANIIFGSALDPSLEGRLRVSVVATGIDAEADSRPHPVIRVLDEGNSGTLNLNIRKAQNALPDLPKISDKIEKKTDTPPDVVAPALKTETDLFSQTTAAEIEKLKEQDSFIPPEPTEIIKKISETRSPDPFREAELLNSSKPQESRPTSLLRRMTEVAWPRRTSSALETGHKEPLEEASNKEENHQKSSSNSFEISERKVTGDKISFSEKDHLSSDTNAAESPGSELSSPRGASPDILPERSKAISSMSSTETERSGDRQLSENLNEIYQPEKTEEDLLDIPAFLRRQAN
jgi:cell division protein FtsZ